MRVNTGVCGMPIPRAEAMMMTRRLASFIGFLGLVFGATASGAAEGLIAFDTVAAGPLPRGTSYAENGMQVTSFSDFSSLGDPLGAGGSGNWIYFHGTNQYIEFSLGGAAFDLVSFEAATNGFTNGRWVTASSGATQTFAGLSRQTVTLGAGFQGITWFRIGTPSFATQVDNVKFSADRIPGQCNDGEDLTISASTAWPGGSYSCGHLRVASGATLTLPEPVIIDAAAITVDVGGLISANGSGFISDQGPGAGGLQALCGAYGGDGGGGGYGGKGGNGNYGVTGGVTYGSAAAPVDAGSGGGACGGEMGGNGGGVIELDVADALTLHGSISANGTSGRCSATSCGGGGAGGGIFIRAGSVAGDGQLTANGGAGQQGGGGGGGRIAVYHATSTFAGATVASGGSGLAGTGEEGTIGFFNIPTNDFYSGGHWRFQANDGPFSLNNVTIGDASRSVVEVGVTFEANTIVLNDSARLEVLGADQLNVGSMHLTGNSQVLGNLHLSAGTLTIDAGSVISADGMGFPSDQGPGAGGFQDLCGTFGGDGGGGGYGGRGGNGNFGVIGGVTYGSAAAPVDAGSGGGACGGELGGSGGGVIELDVADALTLHGSISANGTSGRCSATSCGGGGAGGSIFIRAGSVAGDGQLTANGGAGQQGGGGGGGRIALIHGPPAFTGTADANGAGGGSGSGEDGSVVVAETRLVISPDRGGDTGNVSVVISGLTFAPQAIARLVRGSETIDGVGTIVGDMGSTLRTTFNLVGRQRGEWDVAIDSGENAVTLVGGFSIERGRPAAPWVDIVGPTGTRPAARTRYYVQIGNGGNVDVEAEHVVGLWWPNGAETEVAGLMNAYGVPLPQPIGEGQRRAVGVFLPHIPAARVITLPVMFRNDSGTDAYLGASIVPLRNATFSPPVEGTAPSSARSTRSNASFSAPPQGATVFLGPNANNPYGHEAIVDLDAQGRPVVWDNFLCSGPSCEPTPLDTWRDQVEGAYLGWAVPPGWTQDKGARAAAEAKKIVTNGVPWDIFGAFLSPFAESCASSVERAYESAGMDPVDAVVLPTVLTPGLHYRLFTGNSSFYSSTSNLWHDNFFGHFVVTLVWDLNVLSELAGGTWVDTVRAFQVATEKVIALVNSRDPNDKSGAWGSGTPLFYVSGEQALRYVINFENEQTATAPAQEVVITDQLASELDLSTFAFGPVAFGERVVGLPPGANVQADVDLRPETSLVVRVNAQLDEVSGRVEWRFSSLDPTTGLPPEDPFAGFLPPNVNPPEGDGSVVFTVAPRADLPTGTQITNQASIVFDTNEPILTPLWLNTINQPRCGSIPDVGCRQAATGASSLKLRDQLDDTKDSFRWKWNNGDLTELVDFRDPVRSFNDYRICVYDALGGRQLLMEAEIFPGENCGDARCWKPAGQAGVKFKSQFGVPNGITSLTLKAGPAGKAKLAAAGKGLNLRLPALPMAAPVTVQFLVNDGRSRECWETTYAAPVTNEGGKFVAKGP